MRLVGAVVLVGTAASTSLAAGAAFEAPQKLKAADKVVEVEQPGYASPCVADIDGDGVPDLLVGQFNDGKIAVHKGTRGTDGKLSFGAHSWLQAGGADAVVPGVW